MSGASCSPCFIGRSETSSRTTSSPSCSATVTSGVAVSKASSTRATSSAVVRRPSSPRRCRANDAGARSQMRGSGSCSTGTTEAVAPPTSTGTPAYVVAHAVWQWPTSSATTWSWRSTTAPSSSGSRSRMSTIRGWPRSTGGWWRARNVGPRVGEPLVEAGEVELAVVDAHAVARADQGVEADHPGAVELEGRARGAEGGDEPLAHVVVAGDDELGPGQRSSQARASAYSSGWPWSATSPVTTRASGAVASRWSMTACARAAASGGPPKWVSGTWARVASAEPAEGEGVPARPDRGELDAARVVLGVAAPRARCGPRGASRRAPRPAPRPTRPP